MILYSYLLNDMAAVYFFFFYLESTLAPFSAASLGLMWVITNVVRDYVHFLVIIAHIICNHSLFIDLLVSDHTYSYFVSYILHVRS